MSELNRRHLLTIVGAGLTIAPSAFATSLSQDIAQRLAQARQDGKVTGLHTLLVSQGGRLVFEYYGQGDDEAESRGALGTVVFGPDVPHDLRSVSKSVVGLAYGIALGAGNVPSPEDKLYEQFPEYSDLASQPGRDRLTVHHVLSMTLGLDWDELTIPYGDPRNAENAMEAAPDRFRFILERPIVGEPGARWTYCGGATALLGRLIAKGTEEPLLAYCRRVLFDPMGFGPADWARGRDGEFRAASGLRGSRTNDRFNIQFVDDRRPKGTNQRDASSVIRISLGTDVQSIKNAALLACALLGYQSEEDSCGFPTKYTMLCLARIPKHSSIRPCRTLRIPLKNTPLCLPAICL